MSVYAVGDIQGCYAEFRQLLDLIAFDPAHDRLWLVGDLVNRGPESLSVLRTVRELGASAVTVLGNHDFHLLTVAAGHRRAHDGDTLGGILDAPDRDELLAWLRTRPLVVLEDEWLLVHAGLLPSWTPATALMLSREVEAMLASDRHDDFLRDLYGDKPARWDETLRGYDRLRVVVNACTRLRFCAADDTMELREKRGPDHTPSGFAPWFTHAERGPPASPCSAAIGRRRRRRPAMSDRSGTRGGPTSARPCGSRGARWPSSPATPRPAG
jgi:bis(5'-nucleosyl)-tetraphosphatase (symmetrical)